ncbi:uncharacterized protein JN550_006227 [Neoarthrinium moseri]|uniref:uncharacterized protein n=1 Tax=Neoarthrinium moseri TaxID=1658444 RepID=UPI001FDD850C|nr:uncharacterized protein JN550_006227 [Neoarthrinium moseri]KAI1868652.1 hypothetical protein JN550_006227 [Neoarthrinium moseri]
MRIRHLSSGGLLASALTSLTAANYVPPVNYAAVERRDTTCPANYFSCESQGSVFAGVCCVNGQACALDSGNNPACCPFGKVCTGAAPTATTGPGGTSVSYVSNSLFAFPAIATSFSNGGACASALSSCSANYALCTSDLASGTGGYAVTIAVPGGGGVTTAPTHARLDLASATSVCASLSSQACHGLAAARCETTGSAGGFYVGTANAAGPRVTGAPCMVGMMAGVGLGVLGAGF